MKKFLKALLVILVVVLSIGGTCYIFFKNYKRKEAEKASLITCINKMDKLDLSIVNYDGKFEEIEKTNENLENSLFALSVYFIDDEFIIENEDIIAKIKNVDNAIDRAGAMLAEFKLKSEFKNSDNKTYFDKNLGRNDLYNAMCDYIVEYATLVSMINTDLEYKNINKSADIKFEMIDLYCRVATNTFVEKESDETTGITKLKDTADIHVINTFFNLSKSYLSDNYGNLVNSSYNNKFIKAYSVCDKSDFAKNLSENFETVTELEPGLSDAQIATYYLKRVYGV